jgi:hypothetical protein
LAKSSPTDCKTNLSLLELLPCIGSYTLLALAAAISLSAAGAQAATNLVKNGDFELTSNGTSKQLNEGNYDRADRTYLTDWSSKGYNFVLNGNNIDDTNAATALALWGPNSTAAVARKTAWASAPRAATCWRPTGLFPRSGHAASQRSDPRPGLHPELFLWRRPAGRLPRR